MANIKPHDVSIKTLPETAPTEVERQIDLEQQVGEGIAPRTTKYKNIFLPSDKVDTTKFETMTVNQMICHIRSNRRINNN